MEAPGGGRYLSRSSAGNLLVTNTAAPFQATSLAAPFGGAANVAREGNGESGEKFTIIPLPAVPSTDYTAQRRGESIALTYQGRLQEAVDLYRGTVEADGWMCGILDTMSHGLLGLPLSFQGSPEMCSALLNADGTAGDYAAMHPGNECAKIFRDGLGLGFGWGQYLLMCWRCGCVEMVPKTDAHITIEVCKRCGASTFDRPPGVRKLYQLRWRDARWFFRIPTTGQWYYTGQQGVWPITPGDGEWFLFQTIPDMDTWRHGPWVWATIAAIFARDATFDRQNTSAVCAPTPVFEAKGPTAPRTRREVDKQAEQLRFGNKLVLPGEWSYRIESATATYNEVAEAILDWAIGAFEVGLTGNRMGMQAQSAFTDANVYKRTTSERRAFYAGEWARQIREQGLTWWGRDNFGSRNVPVGQYDVRSPEDKLAEAKFLAEYGDALGKLSAGYDALGYDLTPAWIAEQAQNKGIRIAPKPAASTAAAKLTLSVEGVNAITLGADARSSEGFPPFGDERDRMTVADLIELAKAKASGSNSPGGVSPPAPAPPGAPLGPSLAPPAARLEEDDGPDAGHEDAARFAAEMTQHGLDRCPHGRTHACPRCGIQRVYSATGKAPDGSPLFGLAWRPTTTPPATTIAPVVPAPVGEEARARGNIEPNRDAGGKFAAGVDHASKIPGGSFGEGEQDPHSKAKWAALKAKELGRPVYVTTEHAEHSGGYKLATKIGARDAKGPHSIVHPDGRIEHKNGGADRGSSRFRLAAPFELHDPEDEPHDRARLGGGVSDLDAAEERLRAALAILDALPPLTDEEDDGAERARFNPDQPRRADGKFGSGGPSHDEHGNAIVHSAGSKDGLGRSKAAKLARSDSSAAQALSDKAKAGGSHEEAARAHEVAAQQHRDAAKASARPDYKAAHEAAAKAHEDVAKAHEAEHEKATKPKAAEPAWEAGRANYEQKNAEHKIAVAKITATPEYNRAAAALSDAHAADKRVTDEHKANVEAAKKTGDAAALSAAKKAQRAAEKESDKKVAAARSAFDAAYAPINASAQGVNEAHDAWKKSGSDYYAAHIEAHKAKYDADSKSSSAARNEANEASKRAITTRAPADYRAASEAHAKAAEATRSAATYHPEFSTGFEVGDLIREKQDRAKTVAYHEKIAAMNADLAKEAEAQPPTPAKVAKVKEPQTTSRIGELPQHPAHAALAAARKERESAQREADKVIASVRKLAAKKGDAPLPAALNAKWHATQSRLTAAKAAHEAAQAAVHGAPIGGMKGNQ